MQKLYMVIGNSGDGSNFIEYFTDEAVIEKVEALADDGDESYASGDGLQLRTLKFEDDFDLQGFIKTNHITLTVLSDFDGD